MENVDGGNDGGNQEAPPLDNHLHALADYLRPLLAPKPVYVPPKVTAPHYRHQVDINTEVINLLLGGNGDWKNEAIEKLKQRNTLLALAETNPTAFKLAESMKSLEHFGKGNDSSALLSAAMLASAFADQPSEKRKRPNSDQPFRQRGVEAAYSAPPSYPQAFPSFMPQNAYSNGFSRGGSSGVRGGTRFRSSPPCFNCGESGHFMSSCPNKR